MKTETLWSTLEHCWRCIPRWYVDDSPATILHALSPDSAMWWSYEAEGLRTPDQAPSFHPWGQLTSGLKPLLSKTDTAVRYLDRRGQLVELHCGMIDALQLHNALRGWSRKRALLESPGRAFAALIHIPGFRPLGGQWGNFFAKRIGISLEAMIVLGPCITQAVLVTHDGILVHPGAETVDTDAAVRSGGFPRTPWWTDWQAVAWSDVADGDLMLVSRLEDSLRDALAAYGASRSGRGDRTNDHRERRRGQDD